MLAEENVVGEVLVESNVAKRGRCFALKVTGQSMKGAGLRDGYVVIVRQQPVAENGDIAARQGEGALLTTDVETVVNAEQIREEAAAETERVTAVRHVCVGGGPVGFASWSKASGASIACIR